MMDRNLKILIFLPFVLIGASLMSLKLIDFKPALTLEEMRLLGLVPERLAIPEGHTPKVYRDMRSPIEVPKAPKGFPSTPLSLVAPPTTQQPVEESLKPKVSMIVVSKDRKMAIVNNLVVKEGDAIGNIRIIKIEKDRVLIKDQRVTRPFGSESRWVYLEGK